MNLLIIGLGVGLLLGVLLGAAYVERIVDIAILRYRVDEEKRKLERLKQYLNDMEDGGEEK